MKKLLIGLFAVALFVGCHKDDNEEEDPIAERTVLIYMAAQNNLSYWPGSGYRFAESDLKEIKKGVKNLGDNHLVIYVDKAKDPVSSYDDHKPYLLHYRKGELKDSIPMDSTALACDPATFKTVIKKPSQTFLPRTMVWCFGVMLPAGSSKTIPSQVIQPAREPMEARTETTSIKVAVICGSTLPRWPKP